MMEKMKFAPLELFWIRILTILRAVSCMANPD